MQRWSLIVVSILAARSSGCGTAASTPATTFDELPAPFTQHAPPPRPDEIAGAPFGYDKKLVVTDDGGLVVVAVDRLALVDTRRRVMIDQLFLDSPMLPDRSNELRPSAWLRQTSDAAIWQWDAAQHTIVGATCLGGSGDVRSGLAVWTPSKLSSPIPIAHAAGSPCLPLAISRDATKALVRVGPSAVRWYAIADGSPASAPIEVELAPVLAAVSPDGAWIAFGSERGELVLYHAGADSLRTLTGSRNRRIHMLGFSPTGRALVATGDAETVAWDVDPASSTAKHVADQVDAFAFSPDGARLALATAKQIAIVDGTTFAPRDVVDVADATAVAWTADETQLVASTRHALVVHDLAPPPPPVGLDRAWFEQLHALPVPPPPREPAFATDGSIDGRVLAHGAPVADVEVRLTVGESWPLASKLPPMVARTGTDGAFHFSSVPRVSWLVTVAPPGMTTGSWGVTLRDRKTATGEVAVEPAVTIHGVVLAPDGRPAAGARVVHDATYGNPRVETTTAADGSFTLDHVDRRNESGHYSVVAWGTDGAIGFADANLSDATGPKLAIKLTSATDPHVLRVKFIDEHGAPIAGARVSFSANVPHDRTDANGVATTWLDVAQFSGATSLHAAIAIDDANQGATIALPAHDEQVITVHTAPPTGNLLPVACSQFRDAIKRLEHCDRVPQPTRDALAAEFLWSAPRWLKHPERIGSACEDDYQRAREVLETCR